MQEIMENNKLNTIIDRWKYKYNRYFFNRELKRILSIMDTTQLGPMLFEKNPDISKIITSSKKKLKIEYKDFQQMDIRQIIELNQQGYISMKECTKIVKRKMMKEMVVNRPQFWSFFTRISQYRELYGDFYYQNLKFIKFPLIFQKQIDKDIKRTASHDEDHDKIIIDKILKNMNEVLVNYSRRNAYVGYCQGLNFIVYFLLQNGYQNEECFWILTNTIENILPINYFTSMEDVMVDMIILQKLVMFYIPDLNDFMIKIQADLAIPVIRWFLCLFTSSDFKKEIVQVIWDFLIFEGNIALFKASLLVLQMIKKQVKKSKDFAQAIRTIEMQVNQINDPVDFHHKMSHFYISKKMLKFCRIKFNQEYHIKRQKEIEIRKDNLMRSMRNKKKQQCDKQFPICTNNMIQPLIDQCDFFIFRLRDKLDIQLDFLNGYNQKISDRQCQQNTNNKQILISRFDHKCQDPNKDLGQSQYSEVNEQLVDENYFYNMNKKQEKLMNYDSQIEPIQTNQQIKNQQLNMILDIDDYRKRSSSLNDVFRIKKELKLQKKQSSNGKRFNISVHLDKDCVSDNDEYLDDYQVNNSVNVNLQTIIYNEVDLEKSNNEILVRLQRTQSYAFVKDLNIFSNPEEEHQNLYQTQF